MNQLDDMGLAHQINQELTVAQAIADKTEQLEKEQEKMEREHQKAIRQDDEEEVKEQEDDDLDDMMDEEEEKLMRKLKEQRLAEMKEEYQENQKNKALGTGTYSEILETEFLPTVTKTQYVVCAFFHKDFERCKIIDMHLQKIAPNHTETLFVKIDAERAPFFVNKLQIRTLPTIVCFEDGIAIDQIVGFEELGEEDDFPTMNLIRKLVKIGMLLPKTA